MFLKKFVTVPNIIIKRREQIIKILKKENEEKFKDFYFVTAALDKNTTKENIKYLIVHDNKIICTDSKRLHMLLETDLEKGFYEVIKRTKSEIVLSKNKEDQHVVLYNQIIPTNLADRKKIKWDEARILCVNISNLFKNLSDNNTIQIKFLEDLQGTYDVYAEQFTNDLPVLFKNEKRMAILMPCQIEKSNKY